jgi:hypothetical protein
VEVFAIPLAVSSICDNILLIERGWVELGIQPGWEECIAACEEGLPGATGDGKATVEVFEILLVKLLVPPEWDKSLTAPKCPIQMFVSVLNSWRWSNINWIR